MDETTRSYQEQRGQAWMVEQGLAQARKDAAKRRIGLGVFWMLLGIVVTWATYSSASSGSGGGHYVVMWGAIVYGLIDIVRGLAELGD